MTLTIGIMLDSTERVRKNQKIPKDISLYFLYRRIPEIKISIRNNMLKKVLSSNRCLEIE